MNTIDNQHGCWALWRNPFWDSTGVITAWVLGWACEEGRFTTRAKSPPGSGRRLG